MGRPLAGRIDLGLAVSALSLRFGDTRTLSELAAYCDCTRQYMSLIEQRALRKLRQRLFLGTDGESRELLDQYLKR